MTLFDKDLISQYRKDLKFWAEKEKATMEPSNSEIDSPSDYSRFAGWNSTLIFQNKN